MRQPSPAVPSGSAGAPSKVICACLRVGSMVSTLSRVTPGPFRSTRNSEIARSSSPAPERAATMATSATSPSGTGSFAPVSLPPATLAWMVFGVGLPLPSTRARRRWSRRGELRQPGLLLGLGARRKQELGGQVDRRRDRHRRDGAAQLLGHHAELQMVAPRPPYSSGIAAPRKPISARPFQSALS